MFTGIIEQVGTISAVNANASGMQITVSLEDDFTTTKIGDSIAINGACLTVTKITSKQLHFDVMNESIAKTTLITLKCGDKVNVERALKADGRFDGHIVSGHIDYTAKVCKINHDGFARRITIQIQDNQYFVSKGSVTIDGISLTIAECDEQFVTVSIIPHTNDNTTLKQLKCGDEVNIEVDILGKYVKSMLNQCDENKQNKISKSFLEENGF